jgi:hypothetical protein
MFNVASQRAGKDRTMIAQMAGVVLVVGAVSGPLMGGQAGTAGEPFVAGETGKRLCGVGAASHVLGESFHLFLAQLRTKTCA